MVLGGGSLPTCSGSESVAADVNVGTVQAVDAARFTGYLYTALGHIHRPAAGRRPTVRYAGSRCAIRWMSAARRKAPFWFISGPAEPNRSFCPCARCTPCATSPVRWTS